MNKSMVITYLIDSKKFVMIFPYRKDVSNNEILKEAEQEMIKRDFNDFELLDWRWVEHHVESK